MEARPFFSGTYFTGDSRSPDLDIHADPTDHVPHGLKFRFPPKVSSPARSAVSRPFFMFGSLPFVFFVLFSRGDAAAMVNDNTPYFGMTVKFSRPKSRKSDHDRECLKALREV